MKSGTSAPGRWEHLGALLIQRRTQLSPRFHNRGAFCEAAGLKYRLIYDVEEARRTNFGSSTIAAIEAAYRLAPGAIGRFLAGGTDREILPAQDTAPAGVTEVTRHPVAPSLPRESDLPYLSDVDNPPAGLLPFLAAVHRDLYRAAGLALGPGQDAPVLPEVDERLAGLPGERLFRARHEAQIWDDPVATARQKIMFIATVRMMAAEAMGEPGQQDAMLKRSNSAAP